MELLEGDRSESVFVVAGTTPDMLGMKGYLRDSALLRLLGQQPLVTSALMEIEASSLDEVERRLVDMPAVSDSSRPGEAEATFREEQGGLMLGMSAILTLFASVIAVGVVYNNARVTLSMRSRDLASMRVLGFSRAEISTVLLGELAIHVLLALPLGMWLGTQISGLMLVADPENFRLPVVINPRTYAFAAVVTITTALISGLLVRRKLDNLDLIGVLKTRE
jgi:putative ABC transport system permease protein